jgi:large subunit ribosomal protein L15
MIKKGPSKLKVFGDGELTTPLKISAHKFSKKATEIITAAGGEITNAAQS